MEFDQRVTYGVFLVLLAVLVGGTISSPMPSGLSVGISAGLVVFGVVTLLLGIKHGEYRASR